MSGYHSAKLDGMTDPMRGFPDGIAWEANNKTYIVRPKDDLTILEAYYLLSIPVMMGYTGPEGQAFPVEAFIKAKGLDRHIKRIAT